MSRTITIILIIAVVIAGSFISTKLWDGKPEELPQSVKVEFDKTTTIAQFGDQYDLKKKQLKNIFNLSSPQDLKKFVANTGIPKQQLNKKVNKARAIHAEQASKNWLKIPLKGALWILFLAFVFALLKKGKVTTRTRKYLYFASAAVFGIILGSDPSPMGTVKDAIVLFGSNRVIFPPRLIAFVIFTLLVIIANKFICSWGCQLGTLQDLIFRINNSGDKKTHKIKVPFVISNSIRIAFFAAMTVAAFIWAFDIVGVIDPFKVFKPGAVGIIGGIFIAAILIASLFIYRPWCHFFCPFGLTGWLAEKISIFKIKVDYDKCIACEKCAKECPSSVMEAILKQDRTIPDCFSCGTCIETCPVKAISFDKGKRNHVLPGKFKN